MTDQELAQEVARRLWAAEAACQAVLDDANASRLAKAAARLRLKELRKAHGMLERAHRRLMLSGDVAPLSGSPIKP